MFDPLYLKDLEKRIEKKTAQYRDRLMDGSIKDIADYKRSCGILEGVKLTLDVIREMERKANPEDEY